VAGTDSFTGHSSAPSRPVIGHWDGRRWRIAWTGSWTGGLDALAVASATNGWALGGTPANTTRLVRLTRRGWRDAAFPGGQVTLLANIGIAAAGSRAWIIASPSTPSSDLWGWNGRSWAPQAVPCPSGDGCQLAAIAAMSGSNAWAVGSYFSLTTGAGAPYAIHWNGRHWAAAPVQPVSMGYFAGIALSWSGSWAAGSIFNTSTPLLYKWTGHSWARRPAPPGMTPRDTVMAVDGGCRLWLTGMNAGDRVRYLELSGGRWKTVLGAPSPGETNATVNALAAIPGGSALWSAGLGEIPTANARARIELHGALRVPGCAPSGPPA
jgi:hypothetical protein